MLQGWSVHILSDQPITQNDGIDNFTALDATFCGKLQLASAIQ
jgi:hypothetical protein